ncbi:MAG: flagellar hook-basal body complex protein FliE [Armatimonadetes bacterium]|nr:flagellar hook-basal body complex protein FliE [Armatimonadota bacterium]
MPSTSLLSNIGNVGRVPSLGETGPVGGVEKPGQAGKGRPGMSFKETVQAYLGKVNDLQETSADYAKKLAAGEEVDLHKVMIAGEQAGMAMSMTIQLRNRIVEAYQEVLRMQV